MDTNEILKNSEYAQHDENRIPSPDFNMINCVLEHSEIRTPLEGVLNNLVLLNVLELVIIIMLLFLIGYKYIYKFNIKYTSNLIGRFFPSWKTISEKSIQYNDKFIIIMFIYLSVLLILMKLGNILACGELLDKIDDFVLVYTEIKKKSLICLFYFNIVYHLLRE